MAKLLKGEKIVPDEDVQYVLDGALPCSCGEMPHYVREPESERDEYWRPRVRVACTNPNCSEKHEVDENGDTAYYSCRWDAMEHWNVCHGEHVWGMQCHTPG
jgi:hypothetical protein